MDTFDPNLPIYMACCNYFHSTTASKMVGFVEVFAFAGFAANVASVYWNLGDIVGPVMLSISIMFTVAIFLSVLIMARGIQLENHTLLLVHSFVQVAAIFAYVGIAIVCAVFIKRQNEKVNENFAVCMALALAIVLMEVWFIAILYGCYRYYKDKSLGVSGRVL